MDSKKSVYEVLNDKFKYEFEYFNLSNNIKLQEFLSCHTKNYKYLGINKIYENNYGFENEITNTKYKAIVDFNSEICIMPINNSFIEKGNNFALFRLGREIHSVVLNANGLFIEKYDLSSNIETLYYNNNLLKEISKKDIDIYHIDSLINIIKNIEPSKIIKVFSENGIYYLQSKLKDSSYKQEKLNIQSSLYKAYYNYMTNSEYYEVNPGCKYISETIKNYTLLSIISIILMEKYDNVISSTNLTNYISIDDIYKTMSINSQNEISKLIKKAIDSITNKNNLKDKLYNFIEKELNNKLLTFLYLNDKKIFDEINLKIKNKTMVLSK